MVGRAERVDALSTSAMGRCVTPPRRFAALAAPLSDRLRHTISGSNLRAWRRCRPSNARQVIRDHPSHATSGGRPHRSCPAGCIAPALGDRSVVSDGPRLRYIYGRCSSPGVAARAHCGYAAASGFALSRVAAACRSGSRPARGGRQHCSPPALGARQTPLQAGCIRDARSLSAPGYGCRIRAWLGSTRCGASSGTRGRTHSAGSPGGRSRPGRDAGRIAPFRGGSRACTHCSVRLTTPRVRATSWPAAAAAARGRGHRGSAIPDAAYAAPRRGDRGGRGWSGSGCGAASSPACCYSRLEPAAAASAR